MNTTPLFPMFLKLAGRTSLAVGAGNIGEPKIRSLVDSGAQVRVVAPTATPAIAELAGRGELTWVQKTFEPSDLDGIFLVVAATSSPEINHAIYNEAQRRSILCNVVDDPPHCDFFYPAVVRRGHFQIAISTNGLSPALAQRLRKQLEAEFPPIYGEWLEHLGETRHDLFQQIRNSELRRYLIHESVSAEAFAQFVHGATGVSPVLPARDGRLSTTASGKELL